MRILSLDISTSAGWAILDGPQAKDVLPDIIDSGLVKNPRKVKEHGKYPWSYKKAADWLADELFAVASKNAHLKFDAVVIEETNGSKSRYTQKILEFIHKATLDRFEGYTVVYVDTREWRSVLGCLLSKDQKKANQKLSKAKREAEAKGLKVDKKALGIKGKVTKKHVAINWANEHWKLDLKAKDDDIADALCVGTAFLRGATPSDGT
jgi:hypothetical protein